MQESKPTFIHVGNIIDKATREELTQFVKEIFICGQETG